MTASTNLEAAANAVAEDIASDVRGVLASKDLDSVPHIKALRQRIDSKLAIARELAAEKSRIAAKKAREAANRPTPTRTTSRGRSPAPRWPWACWWACCLAAAERRLPTRSTEPGARRRPGAAMKLSVPVRAQVPTAAAAHPGRRRGAGR